MSIEIMNAQYKNRGEKYRRKKGMLKQGTKEFKERISETTKKAMYRPEVQEKIRRKRKPLSDAHKAKQSDKLVGKEPKNLWGEFWNSSSYRSKRGWIEIGGKKIFMKSIWERNYARYLQWLKEHKQIKDWEYEPKVFLFEKIQFGNRTYKPDFKVTENNNSYHWDEVKGWMDDKSRVKLKRMAKYFPEEKVNIIDEGQYRALSKQLRRLVPDWEIDRNVKRDWSPIV